VIESAVEAQNGGVWGGCGDVNTWILLPGCPIFWPEFRICFIDGKASIFDEPTLAVHC
jgi:hypothetical protein